MNIDWIKEAEKVYSEMANLREFFHKNAELGNNEFKTADKIEEVLKSLGIKTTRLLDTAVVGLLEVEGSNKCIGLRSDIDALPTTEETGLPFSSVNEGVMHACGHDMHIAAQLGAAMILANNKDKLTNSVKFLFQPDEEGNGGAQRMIDAGVLENPKVSAVYGAHVYPELNFGTIGTKSGPLMAISTAFDIIFHGKSAHGAERKAGNDALAAAAEFTKYAITLNRKDTALTIGAFHSGTIRNIIADKAVLNATLRTLTVKRRDDVLCKLHAFAKKLVKKYGVTYEINVNRGYVGICNSEENFKVVKKVSTKLLGAENTITLKEATMKSEDFGCFVNSSSGCFYFAGVGGEYALHNSHFAPDNKALINVAALQAALSQE